MINRTHCNACGGPLNDVFDMGSLPLANGLLTADQIKHPCDSFPLEVAECQTCSLVQLRKIVEPEILYRDYRFFTGASAPNTKYFGQLAEWIRNRTTGNRILEIGSNDGTLLSALETRGFDVIGVDPAVEQCRIAESKLSHGQVVCEYWGENHAIGKAMRFDVIVACNVLGHAANLNDFLGAVRHVIAPGGLFVVEVQYLSALMQEAAFELIYHEHVSYFDEVSLSAVLGLHGFKVRGWETTDSQCGTLRMWATVSGNGVAVGWKDRNWTEFRIGVASRTGLLRAIIDDACGEGRRVCFYGAPAKATQIANYCRLDNNSIQFATDTTPAKQGYYIPGAMIPIVDPSKLKAPDVAIVTAWNHLPFIEQKEAAFMESGGELICPTLQGCQSRRFIKASAG